MLLRCRRSLPTENASSAGNSVMMATRTGAGRTAAIDSQDVSEAGAHLGGDCVVGVRAVQGDHGDQCAVAEILRQYGIIGFVLAFRRWPKVEGFPAIGRYRA